MKILKWSVKRPSWQRDALRRILTVGELHESDLEELTALCKSKHGLSSQRPAIPLDETHIPSRQDRFDNVKLIALTHNGGVNALAIGQSIEFGPNLTIIYGANAAGKSGYTRILKRACRARGAEEILGNVLSDSAPGRPSATIRFMVGQNDHNLVWSDEQESLSVLSHVSVFDNHCASVYLKDRTNVAYRPFGLDLFDKLSDACEAIRKVLEKEQRVLSSLELNLPDIPEGTAAFSLVTSITSLTKPEEVIKLGTLSSTETKRLKEIKKQLHDLQTDDPKKTSQTLNLRAQRLDNLSSHLSELDEVLTDKTIALLFKARDTVEIIGRSVKELHDTTFPTGLIEGTGSDLWRELWDAARNFSTEVAYPEDDFPFTGEGARCVLCQQDVSISAADRMKRFEKFLISTTQQKLDKAKESYSGLYQRFTNLVTMDKSIQEAIDEFRLENEQIADAVEENLRRALLRRDHILRAIKSGQSTPSDLENYKSYSKEISLEAQSLRFRANQITASSNQETKDNLLKEYRELQARQSLGANSKAVLDEIERKKKIAAYQSCLQDTNTQSITRKSSEVTKLAVTDHLAKSFKSELKNLQFTHLEVELMDAGGTRGAHYHKLVLKRATNIELPRVVSQGEARALSIAAFFAELSTASDQSAIIFDDPVSSLDHYWRDYVAYRLVFESKTRQVIVFTHDIVFLLSLRMCAEQNAIQCNHQYLHREFFGAGVSSPELPWVAMKVNDRIGALRNMWQHADKTYRTAKRDDYDREAVNIYGLLREAWERALEEVLLGKVIERYRPSIQTQQIHYLSDITDDDCRLLNSGMTKSSRWLPGHDKSPAENVPIPTPNEMKDDIEALDSWVKCILKRRK